MSTSQGRPGNNGQAVQLVDLFRRFEEEYGPPCSQLIEELSATYPEITRPGRRTGKALRSICFFVWCGCRDGDLELIPTLFHAAVLLSAQDDYFDNHGIPTEQKESFCAAVNRALLTDVFECDAEGSAQLRELTALWSYVAGTIPRSAPDVRSYWVETACQLNDAMAAENREARRAKISYEEYMRTAILSIGAVFIWATFLAHENVSVDKLRNMTPVLLHGATVARLSNDIASYRERRDTENAVTLVGGRSPCIRILRLVVRESDVFRQGVENMDVEQHVRDVLLHSLEFSRKFYQRTDFDRRLNW